MLLYRSRQVWFVVAIAGILGVRAGAQTTIREGLVDKFNSYFPIDHSRPLTISELCCRLDCIAEELRDDGLVLVKQPDVFSQARMTRFRNDVEAQMSSDLANFHLVLAARINRLDSATTTSTTALGASLAAPGTTNVQAPQATASGVLSTQNNLFPAGPSLFGSTPVQGQGAFANLGLAPNTFNLGTSAAATAALGLGVEPTVYLEEKKRFLEYLNQIRRLNMGPDQNDSSGYGLYLVRMPVSIAPGECTYQGHGADLAVQVEHEFTPDFLPSAFRNLVINDIVDQLGPFIYEVIRTGFYDQYLKPRHDARIKKESLELPLSRMIGARLDNLGKTRPDVVAQKLADYIMGTKLAPTGDPATDQPIRHLIAERITVLARIPGGVAETDRAKVISKAVAVRHGQAMDPTLKDDVQRLTGDAVRRIMNPFGGVRSASSDASNADHSIPKFRTLLEKLYDTALPDDVTDLDDLLMPDPQERGQITGVLASTNQALSRLMDTTKLNVNLPSSRTAKQFYPIRPREILDFFLEDNIYLLATDALEASRSPEATIRSSEIRANIRHNLDSAYYYMSNTTVKSTTQMAALADDTFLQSLLESIREREFGRASGGGAPSLEQLYEMLVSRLEESRNNVRNKSVAAFCWAIAVDSVLLDAVLREDARKVFAAKGLPCEPLDSIHWYYPKDIPNDPGKAAFNEYVRHRWPIITFAIEPVTDQQNIADSFNLKRDLQLALSFAFATGQINFSQLDTFRRQIEQASDTIALNRTITGFAQGNDIFGFRFTPRFQNPPNQRTNLGVIASQLISGGPGPDYQTRKSKLEPGLRELNAVLLVPTFLPTMRVNLASNWFKLNDPEHLVFHTGKMMERGRRVQELRDAAYAVCNAHQYRDADVRVLRSKMAQLDTMLPMQSKVIQLPFENSAAGFDLLSEGASALVPELTGFSGVDQITAVPATAGGVAGTAAATPSGTFSVTNLTSPQLNTTYTIAGGTTSIADVFVFGKYISLLDTRVIAGGRVASFEILSREVIHVQIPSNVVPTTTEDGGTYIEVYVATPNGISNSLLIPFQAPAAAAPSPKVAYDVDSKSKSVDIYYQWLTGPDGKQSLVATLDPGAKKGIGITWDSDTGLAPRQIQAQFSATVNGQNIIMVLQAAADNHDDYAIDARQFTVTLLKRLQDIAVVYPAVPTTPIAFTVTVQPYIPADLQGLRVETTAKTLPSKVTVNLHYNATGVNALPQVAPVLPAFPSASRSKAPAALEGPRLASARAELDPAVVRTAQQSPTLPTPASLNATQPPPLLNAPALLGPNVSSEAEQISKMLTGQPITTTVSSTIQQGAAANPALPALPPQAVAQVPNILVNPSPVVVIPSPATPKKKHKSRIQQMFNKLGNRVSAAASPQ